MNEEISEEKMNSLLARLVTSEFWPAILKFDRKKDMESIVALASYDPFKEPTLMCQAQGIRRGVYMLENYSMAEKKAKDEREKTEEESH